MNFSPETVRAAIAFVEAFNAPLPEGHYPGGGMATLRDHHHLISRRYHEALDAGMHRDELAVLGTGRLWPEGGA